MSDQPIEIIRNHANELALQLGWVIVPITRDTAAFLHARLDYFLNQGMAMGEVDRRARERGELRAAGPKETTDRKVEA